MADRSFSSSHGNTPSRRAGAAFSGPVDLPIPEWARKTVKAQRPNLLASIQRDAAEEKDELAATSASVGARKHRIDHRNVPMKWQDKGHAHAKAQAKSDRRFQRQRVRPLPGGAKPRFRGTATGSGAGRGSPQRAMTVTKGGTTIVFGDDAGAEESKAKAASAGPESENAPTARRLAALKSARAATEVSLLLDLMGKDAAPRYSFIMEHAAHADAEELDL